MQPNELSATEAAARIRSGDLTSEALVAACLGRIDARESEVGAWQHLDRERALAAARAADRAPARGVLHGIPVGIKDIIDTAAMPTGLGSVIYSARQPAWDAACVAAIRAAGGIVLGKTVTTEFAYFTPGKTRNPHNLDHTPGGSSSGTAAAVADFMVPLALGTQTAGSVIRPAAFCGDYGYKASYGDLSLCGIRPFAESLDTLGVFARTIDDIALMREALIAAPDVPKPAASNSPPALGWCRTAQWPDADPCTHDALVATVERWARAGAAIREIELPAHFAALIDAQKAIMAFEAARNYRYEIAHHADRMSDALRRLLDDGWHTPRATYVDAKHRVAQAGRELDAIFAGCDALVVPAAIGEAPLASSGTGDPLMNRMWTALHVPCLAVPVGTGPRGLPLAVQLVAARGNDDTLLRIGRWLA